ncbi:MAG: PilZ domain-containing protein [Elusimicrobia bacterium]|nr:PilZ domain-containing protein [Elusimicrobiota bacterium]
MAAKENDNNNSDVESAIRRYKRIPLSLAVAKRIEIDMTLEGRAGGMHGILMNISAGGMAVIVPEPAAEGSGMECEFSFMGIKEHVTGRIIRAEKKYADTYMLGVQFNKVSFRFEETLNHMAEDHDKCEFRYLTMIEEACFRGCFFRPLCGKRIKKDF